LLQRQPDYIKGFLLQSPACREAFCRVLFLFY